MRFQLPILYKVGTKKGIPVVRLLSLNWLLNTHYSIYGNIKKEIYLLLKKQLIQLKQFNRLHITYEIHMNRGDLMNVASCIDKAFQDFLVREGLIQDDTVAFIPKVTVIGTKVKRADSTVFITIEEI